MLKLKKYTKDEIGFNIVAYVVTGLFSLYCLLPVLMIISSSFTSESYIIKNGFSLFPKEFSVEAYNTIFRTGGSIVRAYGISIFITVVKTLLGILITCMTAYVLYRKDFKYRNPIAFVIFFTTMFSGGLVPSYIINTRYFGFEDKLYSLIIPGMLTPFNIILMRNFLNSISDSIIESCKIDGANDFTIFRKIILPLSSAGLATVGLFIALDTWNSWMDAMLYINDVDKYPLQYLLYQIVSKAKFANQLATSKGIPVEDVPQESLKMAMSVITIGPIILVYPFAQRYFVKGITIGAVKG